MLKSVEERKFISYQLEQLVGRSREQECIQEAVRNLVKVVYLEGQGGIGKTFLLSHAEEFLNEVSLDVPLVVLDVIDFYDTAMHNSIAVEEAIVNRIDPGIKANLFSDFNQALERFRAGHSRENVVHGAFIREYNAWVQERYAVLCFDTAEALEYGRDAQDVIDDCEVEDRETSSVNWIRDNVRALDNTTLLIAGRPTRTLKRSLKSKYTEDEWIDLKLDSLSLDEAKKYFEASQYNKPLDDEMVERIWLLTNGRPILLSLSIDWLHRGVRIQELYKYELEEMRDFKEEETEEWIVLCSDFERSLVNKIRLLSSPMDTAIYYAARARKGFTADMLYKILTDEDLPVTKYELAPEDMEEMVAELAQLSFVKHPFGAREGWYFLHDEMYDLVDEYLWQADYPQYSHQVKTSRFIAERIYGDEEDEGLIAEATQAVRTASPIELLNTRRMLGILKTEQMFYRLEADPQDGYEWYLRSDITAIDQGFSEWDDMLRIELLRFVNTFPYWAKNFGLIEAISLNDSPTLAKFVKHDARALWVHRFLARGEKQKTEHVTRKLLKRYPEADDFWRARVLYARGAALVRMGNPESKKVLRQALAIFKSPDLQADPWIIQHYKGMTYLFMGLQARAEWSHKEAATMYTKAREIFQKNGEVLASARARNNAAFVLVKQGNYHSAIHNAREAVKIRDALGDIVGKGLSLNTEAIAIDGSGLYVNAGELARRALRHLQWAKEGGYPGLDRAIAMVHINLGRIQRHRGRKDQPHTVDRMERTWRRAESHLREAEKLVGELEPYYEFELYNQLGLLYSNWANWSFTRQPEDTDKFYSLMDKSCKYFKQADQFAEDHELYIDQADNLEDWAWVYHLRRAYGDRTGETMSHEELKHKVFDYLAHAEELVFKSISDIQSKGLQGHYILGSIHHQCGRFAHKFGEDLTKALKEYALAVTYYSLFAVNPSDPLERRERVREHIRETFINLLEGPPQKAEEMRESMIEAVEDEGLSSSDLERWMDDLIIDLTWEERW